MVLAFPNLPTLIYLEFGLSLNENMTSTLFYLPPSLVSTLAILPVLRITAAAHAADNMSNCQKTNHWVLQLIISQTESIRLDFSPNDTSIGAANLIIRKLEDLVSSNMVKTCDLTVRKGLTVESILDCLLSEHKDRYRFTAGGQGCRFWVD